MYNRISMFFYRDRVSLGFQLTNGIARDTVGRSMVEVLDSMDPRDAAVFIDLCRAVVDYQDHGNKEHIAIFRTAQITE